MGLQQTDQTGLLGWVDQRFPLMKVWREHLAEYYAPKNFNFWYFFGSLALLALVIQIVSGIFLTIHFKPSAKEAFDSVEYIMRDVPWGWLVRYIHSTGASAFFLVVYLHMFRGLMYGSYRKPRELVWLFGMIIYVALMAEAFMGYLLPWGQMSYWGAQVIINLFNTVPFVGEELSVWIRGDYSLADATLNRFFAFHVIAVPLVLALLVFLHIVSLHAVGSNNPDGIEIKENKDENGIPKDGIPFHPYYTVKDIVGVVGFLILFAAVVFFAPEMGGYFLEHPNFEPANPLATPDHIAPVWYFTPFYAVLRAVPSIAGSAFPGVIAMGAAIVVLFLLPWLDKSPVKSIRYKGHLWRIAMVLFVIAFVVLGVMGVKAVTPDNSLISQSTTIVYFLFFLAMPIYSATERPSTGLSKIWEIVMVVLGAAALFWLITNGLGSFGESTTTLPMGADYAGSSYFLVGFFLLFAVVSYLYMVLLPFIGKREKTKDVPARVTG